MNRRKFIKKGSISTAALFSSFHIPVFSENRKINIGLIGCGWYGMVITKAALNVGGVEVTAICDVDSEHLKNAADELEKLQGRKPKSFKYYQELIDLDGLDTVFIATPPHWHALQFIAACEKGLDIYCEKPLSYDVEEGLAMLKTAKKTGNIVQIGFQRRQSKAFQKAKEMIDDGMVGNIHQIDARIHYNPVLQDTTIQAPPPSLDWDEWCGPAPKLDYRPNIGHMAWRLEKEYGNGHLVDWGIHHIDIIRKIMNLDMPFSFRSTGGSLVLKDKITTPDTLTSTMYFEQVPVTWKHRLWGSGEIQPQFNNGVFFYGDKATLFASDRNIVILPAGKNQEQKEMEIPTEAMQKKHIEDFLRAVKEKNINLISCPIEDAFKSTAAVQLAMIAYYSNSKVDWNIEKNTITGNPQTPRMLARAYRNKYQRPVVYH